MRKFFENPEISISMFETESIEVTTASSGDLNNVKSALNNGGVTLGGVTFDGGSISAHLTQDAVQVFAFKD